MAIAAGSRIGPYEIVSPLGAGGMGEVYRARDTRLNRDVAIKVLPASLAFDAERLRRFTLEAQAAGGLNHPNILVVHDVGADQGVPYVVSELLEGRTLRDVVAGGALPARKAVDYATQIANGLGAAHDKGIVHRDLKPENIFVTRDGRVKILDFGLAKAVAPEGPAGETIAATLDGTSPGIVLGTVGYMSPEQVRGEPVDVRSDIFSLGAVMYEMFSGGRAFAGKTAADTMSAILREDPPELTAASTTASPALDRVVRRCLEKNREERFQSARDVTFALDAVSNASSASSTNVAALGPAPKRRTTAALATAVAITAIVAGGSAYTIGRRAAPPSSQELKIRQLTFRSGTVRAGRFTPDPKTVVYAAAWEGKPLELYSAREDSSESSPVNLPTSNLLAVSSSGEMALALRAQSSGPFAMIGTLARAPLAGGAARELLDNVFDADFSPDGRQLAVIRRTGQTFQLEYPAGTVLFSAPSWLSNARVAPDGTHVGFISHPIGGDEGQVEIIDTAKQRRTLSSGWMSIQGMAWAPGGRELWFTATKTGGLRSLWAVSTTGVERLVYRAPQRLSLEDIAPDGRVLLTGTTMRTETLFGSISEKFERKLSWFDWATGVTLSPDAKMIAFTESGEGAGEKYGVYIRPTDGSPAIRLADGNAYAISPDKKWVVSEGHNNETLQILPTGAGEVRTVTTTPVLLGTRPGVRWFPDSRRLVITGHEANKPERTWVLTPGGGAPKPLTPEGLAGANISPDGKWLVIPRNGETPPRLFPFDGGPLKPLGLTADEAIAGWLADSRSLMIRTTTLPLKISRFDIASETRTPVGTIAPGDPDGITFTGAAIFAPDGDHYIYSYGRLLGDLFVVEGLK